MPSSCSPHWCAAKSTIFSVNGCVVFFVKIVYLQKKMFTAYGYHSNIVLYHSFNSIDILLFPRHISKILRKENNTPVFFLWLFDLFLPGK
jgi:hypothetical protein